MYILVIQRILFEAILDIFYFPVWWYSFGAFKAGEKCFSFLKYGNQWLAPKVWLVNLFVPMFGQYDLQGRLISFVMRLIQVVFRSAALVLWFFICAGLFVFWLLIPPIISYGLFKSYIN